MKQLPLLLGTVLISLLLASCASNPGTRIAKNPQLFEELTSTQRELVSRGQIAKGLPESGVFLALGHPSRRLSGDQGGKHYTRWEYAALQPIYSNSFHAFHNFSHRGYRYHGFGYGPEIHYIPYRSAYVVFHDGKVSEWERVGR